MKLVSQFLNYATHWRVFAYAAVFCFVAASSHAQHWGTVATISDSLDVNANRLCLGAETNGSDIGCPAYAPYVSATSGYVGIGTTNPASALEVSGSVYVTGGAPTPGWSTVLGIRQNGNLNYMQMTPSGDTWFTSNHSANFLFWGGSVGIATTSPTTAIDVGGTLRIANGGEACDADRAGAMRYASGSFDFCDGVNGWRSLAAVAAAGATTADRIVSGTSAAIIDPSGNVTMRGRLDIVTGNAVTAVGYSAGQSNTGINVTALGYAAAQSNTEPYSVAIGVGTGQNNAGAYLSALGNAAAKDNTGSYVTAIGHSAAMSNIGSNVTALGYYAGASNSGANVTTVGYGTGQNNTGVYVTALGAQSARYNSGSYVTALGHLAATSNTYLNITALGYNAQADKANQVVLGNGSVVEVSTSGVYVGKGVSTTGNAYISGTVKLSANAGEACGPGKYGTIKVENGRLWMCRQ